MIEVTTTIKDLSFQGNFEIQSQTTVLASLSIKPKCVQDVDVGKVLQHMMKVMLIIDDDDPERKFSAGSFEI